MPRAASRRAGSPVPPAGAPGPRPTRLHLRLDGLAPAPDVRVTWLRGARPGPRLLLVAGLHGDELDGIAAVRLASRRVAPERLAGELLCVAVANPAAFRARSRCAPGAGDLNRCFPGDRGGSPVQRLAAALFDDLALPCDAALDFHTAAAGRANLPHVRGCLDQPGVRGLARAFGVPLALHRRGHAASLRRCATAAGVPTVTFEAGAAGRLDLQVVWLALRGIHNVLRGMGMLAAQRRPAAFRLLLRRSAWVRAPGDGRAELSVHPGDLVHEGEEIGRVSPAAPGRAAPSAPWRLVAPFTGVVLGVSAPQACRAGRALCHVARVRRGLPLLERHLQTAVSS